MNPATHQVALEAARDRAQRTSRRASIVAIVMALGAIAYAAIASQCTSVEHVVDFAHYACPEGAVTVEARPDGTWAATVKCATGQAQSTAFRSAPRVIVEPARTPPATSLPLDATSGDAS